MPKAMAKVESTEEKKIQKPQTKAEEVSVFEDPDAIVEKINKTEEFVKKNKQWIGLGAIAIIGGIFALIYFKGEADAEDEAGLNALYRAQHDFEVGNDSTALNGDGVNHFGFTKVTSAFPDTRAGNLSNFYTGSVLLNQGKFEEAIAALSKFESEDLLVQARAYCLIGDANLELNKLEDAAGFYTKAAEYKPNDQFTPGYLMKLATVQELQGKYADAVITYEKIISEFENQFTKSNPEIRDAHKYLSRAKGLAGKSGNS